MKRKILLVGAALCLLLTSLFAVTACRKKDEDGTVESGALIAGTEESVFSIVYPARWEDNEMNAAMDLKYAFADAYESIPKLVDDSTPESQYEILIGNTNRAESAAVLEGLNEYGWAVRVVGNKIVLNAKNNLFLNDAVEYFVSTYIGNTKQLGINHISDHIENSEKQGQPYVISVGENSIYTVACTSAGSGYIKSSAMAFSRSLADEQGVSIPVSTSGTPSAGKIILLATDVTLNGWKISFEENGNISILGQNDALAVCALNYFSSEYMKKDFFKNLNTVAYEF